MGYCQKCEQLYYEIGVYQEDHCPRCRGLKYAWYDHIPLGRIMVYAK